MKFLKLLVCFAFIFSSYAHANKALKFSDVFDFKYAKSTQLSEKGKVLAFAATPYRGDAIGYVYNLETNKLITTVANGYAPKISKNEQWVAFTIKPTLLARKTTAKDKQKTLTNSLSLVNTETGDTVEFKNVKDYTLSHDGVWLAYRTEVKKKSKENTEKNASVEANNAKKNEQKNSQLKADKKDKTYALKLIKLTDMTEYKYDNVLSYAISPSSTQVVISQVTEDGKNNSVSQLSLADFSINSLFKEPGVNANNLKWHPSQDILALSIGNYINDDQRRRAYSLYMWHSKTNQLTSIAVPMDNWFIGKTAELKWSEKGERLYFETRPKLAPKVDIRKYKEESDLYNFEVIRDQKGLNVWHPKDPLIKPNEIKQWEDKVKNQHYQAVYHLAKNKAVQLADKSVANVNLHTEKQFILGYDNQPYLHKIMYDGFFYDYYSINTQTGEKKVIFKSKRVRPTLSPDGQFAAYFDAGHIQLKSLKTSNVETITKDITAIFGNDQHDYPSEQPGYGFAGWSSDSQTLYAYSKHDIWAFNLVTKQANRITNGYQTNTRYRVRNLDKNSIAFSPTDTLLVSAFNLKNKQTGVATLDLSNNTLTSVLSGAARFDLVTKAKETNTLIYTRQTYHEFPDFWVSNTALKQSTKLTELNPQKEQFLWGEKPELVQYKGFDGEDLQGVLIKPAGYQAGDKVPVVIYFYRYMSQRMYDFPKMELNHRPNFPMFTSNGYAIFLPDIRFEVGHPGKSSTQTMINAAQKLIDIGVADKDKIGLQGHSWAGYQSAFMVTQTDIFKAVVSGAPVSNMTSAYSGIRLNSGLARQFQYETGQSRIGKNLFEAQDLYIENSPVFFADKVNTPIMIMFGDKDGAVPWQEGIQYYLALRRAGKDAIFLQYEGEPHHLKQFPNQVDFSIRMMNYFDHYLKGKPAAKWISSGIPYEKE